jgi:hypothetical protein
MTWRWFYADILFAIIFVMILGLFVFMVLEQRQYDCQLAEISPDIPLEIKEQCRRARLKS